MNLFGYLKLHHHSLLSLGVRGASVAAGFGIAMLIGRMFGPEANGHYALVTQTGMFLSVVAVGGLDLAVTREFSAAAARHIPLRTGSFVAVVCYSLLIATVLAATLVLVGQPLLSRLLNGKVPEGSLVVLLLIMLSRTLTRMLGAVLRSQRGYFWGQSVEVLLIPGAILAMLALGLLTTVEQVLWMTAFTGVAIGVMALIACFRYLATSSEALDVPMKRVLNVAVPLWGVAIFLNISDWYGLATVSHMLDVYSAGLYRVAAQVASILSIITMGLFSIFSPQFAEGFATQDMKKVAHLAASGTRLSAIFSAPLAVLLFVFAEPILGLFGPEFVAAKGVLRIMVVGQGVFTITGLAGLLLAMTGHERVNLSIAFVSTGLLLVAAPLAGHLAGIHGIAASLVLLMIGRNIASLYFVYRLNGINVITGKFVDGAWQKHNERTSRT